MEKQAFDKIDQLSVSALRSLVIDETNKAKSGHPGMALDIAPTLYVLFRNYINANPADPTFFNRDRFILSSGHTSALLYAMLHLAGYKVSMDDLKSFRQLDSLTPGHPEFGLTSGVDATAGPLGQGISQAVGAALAEEAIRGSYPKGKVLCDHYTYCLCGDGDLEEGLSQEAISLAGLQKLSKLILIYDENGSTLDGPTSNSLSENEALRFKASHWKVFEVEDGNNLESIDEALSKAKATKGGPKLIIVHTKIGYGTALEGDHKVHGSPIGEELGKEAKAFYGYNYGEFEVPNECYARLKETFASRGSLAEEIYLNNLAVYKLKHKKVYATFNKALNRDTKGLLKIPADNEFASEASRATSGKIVGSLHEYIPFTLGGSADVASSVMTKIPDDPNFSVKHRDAHNFNFGIREFGMAGAQNGMLLHKGLVTYVGCFLIFSDYMKSAIRMSALEHLPAIYLFSHDSIAVGEDGPTHEPVEQLVALRSIPGLSTIRPADSRETYGAWKLALESQNKPTAIILSRQKLPLLDHSGVDKVAFGAYKVVEVNNPDIEILASGSEVSLAIDASKLLNEKGIKADVVSVPSFDLFDEQSEEYKNSVLSLPREKRFGLEMASSYSFYKYADHVYGLNQFGKSAPAGQVLAALGFTPDQVASSIEEELK
jgi:transketolase